MSEDEHRPKSRSEILEDAVQGKPAALKDNNVFEAHKGLRDIIGSKPGGNVKLFAKHQEKEATRRKAFVEEALGKIGEAEDSVKNDRREEAREIIAHVLARVGSQIAEYEKKQAELNLGSGPNLSPDEIVTGFQILETLSCKGMLDSILAAVRRVNQAMEKDNSMDLQTIIGDLVKDLKEQVLRHELAIQAAREAQGR